MFQPGDRVRWLTTGDDGLPLTRYGFVGGLNGDHSRVAVMLDGELKGDKVISTDELAPVEVGTVELRLYGADLLDDPSLRQGLVNLWSAEADQAGLEIGHVHCLGTGVREHESSFALAEVMAVGRAWVLVAMPDHTAPDMICVRAAPLR
ncbi:MAG: hypothetical protein CL424_06250 [Acidimicrobiaceae bacterium]|nr:hypothetical protein [Acidimicrobiaceae bacterium]